ncbi:interleukin-17 receptor C [Dendropsophus ebraccatus]|uniref:interleukin-17 receptor C n=1 Tax=Dendropsophus ebraccatus TaxID=150705 RepID=UPI0038316686
MKHLAFCPLLLTLILHYGLCRQQEITLESLPSNAPDITCTGDLQCNSSDTFCIQGDIETAEFPVLIPTDIRAKTVKKCDHHKGCRLCVQVTVDMSVAFLSDYSDDFGSGNCGDYEDYSEDDDLEDVSLFIKVDKPSNDSLLCANLFILRIVPASFSCSLVRISLPQSSVPRRIGTKTSIKVGSVVYNSVNGRPGSDLNITSFTHPRYFEELLVHHSLPGCKELDPKENIVECEAPSLNFDVRDDVSVGVRNGTSDRNVTLRVFYKSRHKGNDTEHILHGKQRFLIPKSDIVPCLCFEARYSHLVDGVRNLYCPFKNHSEEKVVKESVLIVKIKNSTPVYNLSAACNLSAELSLCWKPNEYSECHEIPYTRREIRSEKMGSVKLENLHPSLCLQVSIKKKVIHTYCLPVNGTKQKIDGTNVLVWKHKHENTSFCFVGENKCIILENETTQMTRGAQFLEQKVVEDINTEQCIRIFTSGENHEFYTCNVAKYMRSRWNWSRGLCLLAVACVLLILLLKNENLKKWIKSVTAEKSPSDIFNNRRILILYSPDSQEYESLVHVFASSLKDLQLDVVLDQWHRVKISEIHLVPWYHQQKAIVFEKEGLIILLFSEGAREKYTAWKAQDEQHIDLDPNQSFGAVLSCVESDFCNNKAKGQYIVATFSPSCSVPQPFNSDPVCEVPLHLEKLLKEIAGVNAKKLGYKQVSRIANKIRDRLYSKDKPESVNPKDSVALELQPLVQDTSKIP